MTPLVVLPTYKEAENILEVLERVRAAAPDADVLVVDDGSPDGTADLAEKWRRRARRRSTCCAARGEVRPRLRLPRRVRLGPRPRATTS